MSHTAHPRTRSRPLAPRHPRRVSGPVRRPVAAAPPVRPSRTTGAFERVRALPDHRLVDGLLRSQAWIWVIGIALGGIVAMQVSLLKLNAGIGRAVETTQTLERQNAALTSSVASLSGGQRIQAAATRAGMVTPEAGAVEYVRVRPGADPGWAARRMRPPSEAARALMANGGVAPAPVVAPTPGVAAAPAVAPVATPAPAAAPVATPAPAAAPVATPAPAAVAPTAPVAASVP